MDRLFSQCMQTAHSNQHIHVSLIFKEYFHSEYNNHFFSIHITYFVQRWWKLFWSISLRFACHMWESHQKMRVLLKSLSCEFSLPIFERANRTELVILCQICHNYCDLWWTFILRKYLHQLNSHLIYNCAHCKFSNKVSLITMFN